MIRDHELAAAVPAPGAGQQVPADFIQDGLVGQGPARAADDPARRRVRRPRVHRLALHRRRPARPPDRRAAGEPRLRGQAPGAGDGDLSAGERGFLRTDARIPRAHHAVGWSTAGSASSTGPTTSTHPSGGSNHERSRGTTGRPHHARHLPMARGAFTSPTCSMPWSTPGGGSPISTGAQSRHRREFLEAIAEALALPDDYAGRSTPSTTACPTSPAATSGRSCCGTAGRRWHEPSSARSPRPSRSCGRARPRWACCSAAKARDLGLPSLDDGLDDPLGRRRRQPAEHLAGVLVEPGAVEGADGLPGELARSPPPPGRARRRSR